MTEQKIIELHDTESESERKTRLEVASTRMQREGAPPAASRTGTQAALERDTDKSSYSSYLFGSSGTDERPAWSDTAQGRLKIRLFSRGIMGAAFFVAGGHVAKEQLKGYESFKKLDKLSHKNFLQYIAKGIDVTAGRTIENMTHAVAKGSEAERAAAAWEVTNFRTKTFNGLAGMPTKHKDRWGFEHSLNGRGLGAEIVTVTFDFFMASIGDAMTRNMIQAFDPNVKQPWLLDKDGRATTRDKGKFDAGKWAESLGRSSWRVLTKNAGEDWAAALPYVYQMKWQRQSLAKVWKGFKLSSDHGWNGGMATVALQDDVAHNTTRGQINGGYQIPGLLDLQFRFMGYNWYTLMYREAYDAAGRAIDKMKDGTFTIKLPEHINPISAVIDTAGFGARYVTKSLIKSGLYMFPAVIPFWLVRTPQSKWKGGFAADELARASDGQPGSALMTKEPVGMADLTNPHDPVFLENVAAKLFPRAKLIHGPERGDVAYYGVGQSISKAEMADGTKNMFNMEHPYHFTGVHRNLFDHIMNPFGWACFKSGSGLTHAVDFVTGGKVDPFTKLMHGKGATLLARETTLRNFVDASFSYTPYMWAKAETALRVDDRRSVEELGHMDKAIYRMIDSAFSFKMKEAVDAGKDVLTLAKNFEKDVKSREGAGANQPSVGDGTTVPRPGEVLKTVPVSKVDIRTIAHEGKQRQHDPVALERDDHADTDAVHTKRWAENVAGRKLDAQFLASQPTLH